VFCTQCGKQGVEGAKFCAYCGARMGLAEAAQGEDGLTEGARGPQLVVTEGQRTPWRGAAIVIGTVALVALIGYAGPKAAKWARPWVTNGSSSPSPVNASDRPVANTRGALDAQLKANASRFAPEPVIPGATGRFNADGSIVYDKSPYGEDGDGPGRSLNGGENSGLDQPAFDPFSLGGNYIITLSREGKAPENWELALNIQSATSTNVSYRAAMVDNAGMAVDAQTGSTLHIDPAAGTANFDFRFVFFAFSYKLRGTIERDGRITGTYTYGVLDAAISGKMEYSDGTLSGHRG
jgi:hypothetical protein